MPAVSTMAAISDVKPSPEPADADATSKMRSKTLVQEYLLEHLPIYRELRELRIQASTGRTASLYLGHPL